MFDQLLLSGQHQIVCGDFNSPGDDGELLSGRLHELLSSYNQQQLVTQSTHQAGNTLDLIIVPEQSIDFVRDVTVHSLLFSDHSLVRCRLGVPPPCPQTVSHTSRDIKRIDLQSFRRGIYTSRLYDADVMESLSTDAYTELFESEVTRVLDVCAPLRTKTRRQGSHDRVPLSEEACIAKRTCRRLERRFRRSGSPSDKQQFHEARSVARDLIYKSRADVLKAKVIESAGDSKKMWNTARQLLHSVPAPTLRDEDCAAMSNTFCQFFIDKVARIKQEITDITRTVIESQFQMPRLYVGSPLVAFTDVTSADVLKLLCVRYVISLHLVIFFRHHC